MKRIFKLDRSGLQPKQGRLFNKTAILFFVLLISLVGNAQPDVSVIVDSILNADTVQVNEDSDEEYYEEKSSFLKLSEADQIQNNFQHRSLPNGFVENFTKDKAFWYVDSMFLKGTSQAHNAQNKRRNKNDKLKQVETDTYDEETSSEILVNPFFSKFILAVIICRLHPKV